MTPKPESVTVLGQPFTIEYVDVQEVSLASDGHDTGRMDLRTLRIIIRADQHEMQIRDTLVHEIIHACLRVQESSAEDEAFATRMAPVLLDVLRSNPQVAAYLLDDLTGRIVEA